MQRTSLKLKIAHLYPDLLNIYGDMGNVQTIIKRSEWRDIEVEYHKICTNQPFNSDNYDLFFAGGGQDTQQIIAAEQLYKNKDEFFKALNKNKPMLTICGSYQLFGREYITSDKKSIQGISLFDCYTIAGDTRFIGNVTAENDFLNVKSVVGFENHSGLTYLDNQESAFLKIKVGNGNNGADKTEGIKLANFFGTYLHGPLLPKNPHFCDFLIKEALCAKYNCDIPLLELNDNIELMAHASQVGVKY